MWNIFLDLKFGCDKDKVIISPKSCETMVKILLA